MTKEAPDRVWKLFLEGDSEEVRFFAFEELVEHYQYLVEAMARTIKAKMPTFIEDEELVSRGQLGLLRAMRKYDPSIGKFSSFASSAIWGAIYDGFRADDFAPRGLRKQQREMDNAAKELRDEGVEVTPSSLGERMGLSAEAVEEIQFKLAKSEIVPTDPSLLPAYKHEASAGETMWSTYMQARFVDWLQQWDDETQEIVLLRHWKGVSLKTISTVMDIPSTEVRAKYRRVLKHLLPFMKEEAK